MTTVDEPARTGPTITPRTGPRALVVGAGIAGLAAATSLHRAGWRVTVCERAPARRTGGYFVRLAPEGVQAAERLGVDEALRSRLPADGIITGVDGRGRTTSRVDAAIVEDGVSLALVRGDLEAALWDGLPAEVEVRFSTAPRAVRDDGTVEFDHGTDRWDLVVGADGIRSTVREMVFGPEAEFRHDFDHVVISAVLPQLPGSLVEGDYVVLVEPGRTAHLMAMSGHAPVVFFTYRADLAQAVGTEPVRRPEEALRAVYGDFDGLMPEILDLVAEAGTTHADTVGQIHLERWSRGRVVLLGDSAWCPTLYSGHGSALALSGGEALGRHLRVAPDGTGPADVAAALEAWEAEQRPGTRTARTAARRARHFFLPGNRVVTAVRAVALWVASWPLVSRVFGSGSRTRGADVHRTVTASSGPARDGAP
ncbi:FAD-dependent oxidoreductase [Actinomycetospora termitidis]|uniref:FAD-dependent monooxygenase n=1 Tax=Actinomycetospora termitidis TaxID=3053470 RepID=A0ABT7MED0_9PSEU|nr:FAD-dependent oxidoreductase [Actinomycetospora sp. Odt1-22]MDL5158816.1 FAD-dependent monooxygenase [Actinomycetospora sp. Odt1-22]